MSLRLERSGMLLVVSAPSGGGKSAVLAQLLAADSGLNYSVSFTSRSPRGKEVDGREYHFVTKEKFLEMAADDAFYEYAEVHGNYYGTAVSTIGQALQAHTDIALDIDVQGGLNIKERQPNAVLVFLMPPSMEVLETRLRGRASDAESDIQMRLANARREMDHWNRYDYAIINEDLNETVKAVQSIVAAERHRRCRQSLIRSD